MLIAGGALVGIFWEYRVFQKKFPKKAGQTRGFAAASRQGRRHLFGNFFPETVQIVRKPIARAGKARTE
jgi:hypothetical protein